MSTVKMSLGKVLERLADLGGGVATEPHPSSHRPPRPPQVSSIVDVLTDAKRTTGSASSSTSKPSSSPDTMGALYEDVEKFFGDMFAWYGRLVARWPMWFVLVPLVVCGLLGLGMFRLQYETDIETLYTPIDTTAAKNQMYLQTLFRTSYDDDFLPHQSLDHYSYAELIATTHVTSNHSQNVQTPNILNTNSVQQVLNSIDAIFNLTSYVQNSKHGVRFEDVCARKNKQCVVIGLSLLESLHWNEGNNCYTFRNTSNYNITESNAYIHEEAETALSDFRVGFPPPSKQCLSASALKIRFYLRRNNTESALSWQKSFFKQILPFHSNSTHVDRTVSDALDIELSRHVGKDCRFLLFSIVTMLLYATVQGGGGNWVSNHVTLAYAGVFAALLSIMAAFGFLSICGLRFVNMSGVMPFLVIGIGVDDMFQLMTEWRHTNPRDSIEQRMANTLRSAAVSITITSLTDLMAFCIGATSPFISVKHFCACSGIAIFFCYINQLTFFSGVIVLHARRVQQGRHCLTCLKTKDRQDLEADEHSSLHILFCSGHPPRKFGEEDGLCGNISRGLYMYYPKFILHWFTKICVLGLFILYLVLSIWSALQLKNGFSLEDVISEDSYVSGYLKKERLLFPADGPTVMFVIEQPVDYENPVIQAEIEWTLQSAKSLPYANARNMISWLSVFKRYLNETGHKARTKREFMRTISDSFLQTHPQFVKDIKLSADNRSIVASRFYVMCDKMNESETSAQMMEDMRTVANNSHIPFLAFSTDFLYFEHYVCILKNTLLAIGVAMIGMLFVALVFIPHPIAVSAVTLSMISAVLGMVGFMTFWGLSLSAITTIQIILSIGICVDSTVHISHAFMTATGKNRNERVSVALEKVGIPILNGACSSLLGILMLALGSSYIFTSFFKTMFLVVVLGLLHSLVFLPVILSFIGPRRTSKPRVFIPVSPSSRSLQDIYRANSVVRPPPSDPPHYEPVFISATLKDTFKTRSLTDMTDIDDELPFHLSKEARRVSFAVGEERKYALDKSFLESKVNPGLKHKFTPISSICESDEEEEEEEEEYDDHQSESPDTLTNKQNDLNDNIHENTTLLDDAGMNARRLREEASSELRSCLKRQNTQVVEEEDDFRDASDSSPRTPKKTAKPQHELQH